MNGNKIILTLITCLIAIHGIANNDSINFDSLIVDQQMYILNQGDTVDTIEWSFDDSTIRKIGLILPLFIDSSDIERDITPFYRRSQVGVSFLEGAKLAFDSLINLGYNLELEVFDSYNDSMQMDSIIKDSSIFDLDLVIGPLYNKNYKQLLKHLDQHNIPMVSPLSTTPVAVSKNYIKNTPSLTNHADKLYEYLADSTDKRKVYLIQKEIPNKEEKIFLKRYKNLEDLTVFAEDKLSWKTMRDSILGDSINIDSTIMDTNLVFIMTSSQESFTYYLFTQMKLLQQNTKDSLYIDVFGMPHWYNFESLDISFLKNYGVHISNSCWINYEDSLVNNFRNAFFETYKTEPSRYNVFGFENMFYYGQYLVKSNNKIGHYKMNWKGISNDFSLTPNIIQPTLNGDTILNYENQNLHIIKFDTEGVKFLE